MIKMQKSFITIFFLFVLINFIMLAVYPHYAVAQNSTLIFHDDFEGTSVNSTFWNVEQNTGFNGTGGLISVSNSAVYLSSDGTSFPCVTSLSDYFPDNRDFTFELSISYSTFTLLGSGFWVSSEPTVVNKEGDMGNILHVWADTSYDNGGAIFLLGKHLYTAFSLTKPEIIRLEYHEGTYSVYKNGVLLDSISSPLHPHCMGFGHPPASYVPFPTSAQWTSFHINSVSVFEKEPSPTPFLTPTGTVTETPTPILNQTETVQAITENNVTINLPINGNITSQQIHNVTLTSDTAFDTTTLAFGLTGEKGTTGFCNITIPINAVTDWMTPVIYIDGQIAQNQGYCKDNNNYYVWFTTHFSEHQIAITFSTTAGSSEQKNPFDASIYGIAIAVAMLAILAALLFSRRSRIKEQSEN